jgi:hypothetical protein
MRRGVLVLAVCALAAAAAPAAASIPPPGVPTANHRVGHPPNKIASGFTLTKIAQGSDPLEIAASSVGPISRVDIRPPCVLALLGSRRPEHHGRAGSII